MKKVLLSILVCTVLFSCKKEKKAEPAVAQIFAETQNMEVTTVNQSMADLDGDGTIDVQLRREAVKISGTLFHFKDVLIVLNPAIFICGQMRKDTLFSHTKVSFSTKTDSANMVQDVKTTEWLTVCPRIDKMDKIDRVLAESNHAVFSGEGDFIPVNGAFHQTGIVVRDEGFSAPLNIFTQQDTVMVNRTSTRNDCQTFFSVNAPFITFRLKKDSRDRIGWIRLAPVISGITIAKVALEK